MKKSTSASLTRSAARSEDLPETPAPAPVAIMTREAELEKEIHAMRAELQKSQNMTFTGQAARRWNQINSELSRLRETAKRKAIAVEKAAAKRS